MKFEWDLGRAHLNRIKHKVSFELASTIFDDPLHLSIPDPEWRGEERWITIGMAVNQKIIVVVHMDKIITEEKEIIRIISARKASRLERRQYEEGI